MQHRPESTRGPESTRAKAIECLALGLLLHAENEPTAAPRFTEADLRRARGEAVDTLAELSRTGWRAWLWDVAAGTVSSAAWTLALVVIGMVALERHGGTVAGLMNAMGTMAGKAAK